MAYAVGKYSKGQCDRCGFVYKYTQLKPVITPTDPEALVQPRGTESAPTTGYGIVKTGNTKNSLGVTAPSMFIAHNDTIGSSFFIAKSVGKLGEVTITIG